MVANVRHPEVQVLLTCTATTESLGFYVHLGKRIVMVGGGMVLDLKMTNVDDKFPSSARGVILINLFLFSRGCVDYISIIMAERTIVIRQQRLFYFTTGFFELVFWL